MIDQVVQFADLLAQIIGTGGTELFFVPETPKDADAFGTCVVGGGNISLAVADIDKPVDLQGIHRFIEHVRRGFAGAAGNFTQSEDAGEEMGAERLDGGIGFVGNDGNGIFLPDLFQGI